MPCPSCKRPVGASEPYDPAMRFEIAYCPCGAVLQRTLENRTWHLAPDPEFWTAAEAQRLKRAGAECESCLASGDHRPATTHSRNPNFAGYALCAECAAEYDSRKDKDGGWAT